MGARPKPTDARKPLRAPPPLPSVKRLAKTGNEDLFAIYHIHTDHLNTPRLVTRPSDRKIVWRWENLDPFGANAAEEDPSGFGAFTFNLRFPGQYFDVETGLHYNYFRDYEPGIGRYVESDPIGLKGGIGTYAYVADNPVSRSDRRGLVWDNPVGGGPPILRWQPDPPTKCKARMSPQTGLGLVMGLGAGAGYMAGAVLGLGAGIGEAAHFGAIAGVIIADATASGAIAGGVLGAAGGAIIGLGVAGYLYYNPQPECGCQ